MTEEQGQASRLGHHIFRAARLGALARKEPERAAVLGLPVRVHVDHDLSLIHISEPTRLDVI
eukprot:5610365-Prorocentrum_lima.AAC.1